jgi:hypothetical protein
MELAVNTLVVLILGVLIVGGGIALMYSIYNKARVLPSEVDKQTQQQLFNILLTSKERIAALDNVQTVARGETATFPVAVQNQLEGQDATFLPVWVQQAAVVPQGVDVTCQTSPPDTAKCPAMGVIAEPFTLKRYDSKAFYVTVAVPKGAASGQYIFNVDVLNSTNGLYARTQVSVYVE